MREKPVLFVDIRNCDMRLCRAGRGVKCCGRDGSCVHRVPPVRLGNFSQDENRDALDAAPAGSGFDLKPVFRRNARPPTPLLHRPAVELDIAGQFTRVRPLRNHIGKGHS